MFKHKAFQNKRLTKRTGEAGNTTMIVLAVLVAAAVGGLAYMSTQAGKKDDAAATTAAATAPATGEAAAAATAAATAAPAEGELTIKPGNPVVAKVNGKDITRVDIFNFIQTLPPQTRQLPVQQLFPIAVEQVVNAQVIQSKTEGVNLDSDPEVKRQMELAKDNIVRGVYIQNLVNAKITEDKLKEAYEQYKKNFPDIEEVKGRHILVKEESKAEDLIKQLDGGADFAELAKANSTDGTAANGGDLGYFAQADVVPPFGEAAFKTDVGSYTKKPVKSDFGYHVIKIEDKRKRPPADYESAKPFLDSQLRRVALDEVIQGWKDEAKIERFDINGEPVEPAAGGDAPAAPPAAAPAQ